MIERAVILAEDGGALDIGHLFTSGEEIDFPSFTINKTGRIAIETDDEPTDLPILSASKIIASLEEAELAMVKAALKDSHGNLSKAARQLGISRAKLAYRMQKYGISAE